MPSANIETILFEAIEIGDHQARCAYIEEACGNNAELRRDVERLIANLDRAGVNLASTVEADFDVAVIVLQIGIGRERPQVHPFADIRMAEEAVVIFV